MLVGATTAVELLEVAGVGVADMAAGAVVEALDDVAEVAPVTPEVFTVEADAETGAAPTALGAVADVVVVGVDDPAWAGTVAADAVVVEDDGTAVVVTAAFDETAIGVTVVVFSEVPSIGGI